MQLQKQSPWQSDRIPEASQLKTPLEIDVPHQERESEAGAHGAEPPKVSCLFPRYLPVDEVHGAQADQQQHSNKHGQVHEEVAGAHVRGRHAANSSVYRDRDNTGGPRTGRLMLSATTAEALQQCRRQEEHGDVV